MKITRTPIHFLLAIVCCCLFSMLSVDMTAQAISTLAPAPPISTEDYPGTKWKSPSEYSLVLSTEQSSIATILSTPNLNEVELGLYTGYARMLTYMQEDITNQTAIEEIASKSYQRVRSETPADPILKHMIVKDFETLYAALLPQLTRS